MGKIPERGTIGGNIMKPKKVNFLECEKKPINLGYIIKWLLVGIAIGLVIQYVF